jgi:hypothetical protein
MDTHPTHSTTWWHGWSLLPHVGVSDDGLGGEEESADGSRNDVPLRERESLLREAVPLRSKPQGSPCRRRPGCDVCP